MDAEACEIEQPRPSHRTSAMVSPSTRARSVISSPQTGFFWCEVPIVPTVAGRRPRR
jgi:hypothetical protein